MFSFGPKSESIKVTKVSADFIKKSLRAYVDSLHELQTRVRAIMQDTNDPVLAGQYQSVLRGDGARIEAVEEAIRGAFDVSMSMEELFSFIRDISTIDIEGTLASVTARVRKRAAKIEAGEEIESDD